MGGLPAWLVAPGMPGIIGQSDSGYDVDSLALFAAMTTAPTTTRKRQADTLIRALKSAAVWDGLDLLYVLAAADSQAARLNWKSPSTFAAVAVNSPTFAADQGYTGNGTSSRLRTQYTPSTNGVNLTQNSASVWVWSRTSAASSGSQRDVGAGGSPQLGLGTRQNTDASIAAINDTTGDGWAVTDGSGFFGITRTDSATKTGWQNGIQKMTQARASTGINAVEQWICGFATSGFSTKEVAAAAWGNSLQSKELSFYNAMLTYMQSVGAA